MLAIFFKYVCPQNVSFRVGLTYGPAGKNEHFLCPSSQSKYNSLLFESSCCRVGIGLIALRIVANPSYLMPMCLRLRNSEQRRSKGWSVRMSSFTMKI